MKVINDLTMPNYNKQKISIQNWPGLPSLGDRTIHFLKCNLLFVMPTCLLNQNLAPCALSVCLQLSTSEIILFYRGH